MKMECKLCLALGLLTVIFIGNVGANNVQRFLIEPQDMEVDQGADITFRCQVNYLLHDQILAWFALDRQVTSDSTVIAQRADGDYAINVIAITSINLVLDNVQPSDDGMYYCAVLQRHTQVVVLRSRTAILIVNFLPDPLDPICTPIIATVHVNDHVTITCDSKTGKPPIHLVWTRADGKLIDAANTTLTTVNLRTILTYKFVATLADHGAIFKCTATNQRFPTYLKRCRVTVDVQFPPKVNITTIPPDEGEDFPNYNCTAIANPDPFIPYVWEINPPFPDTTPIISQDGTILSFNTKPICRQITTGTCTASNIKGSGNDTVIICEPLPTTMPLPTSKISAGRGPSGDGSTTTIVIIILLLLVLFAVLGLCFMYRRKRRLVREQLLSSQPPPNINITVDPHININISSAETIARGNLQEGNEHDNLGINPSLEDESFYLPMGDVKPKKQDFKITNTVTSETTVSSKCYPDDTYIDGYNVEDRTTASGLKPHPKTRKGKVSPKPIPKPRAAPRSPVPHPRLMSRKGLVQALRNGFTFRRNKMAHSDKNNFNMDDSTADYELYKKGEQNVYEGLKPHQDTDDENDSIWNDKKRTQAKFVEKEGAYDLAGALRMKEPPSKPEAKICNADGPTNYYSPVADDVTVTKSTNVTRDSEEYSQAELYGAGTKSANQSQLQSALLTSKKEDVTDTGVEGDYYLVGPMRLKPPLSKSATKAEGPVTSRPDSETYAEAKMYGSTPSAAGINKKAKEKSRTTQKDQEDDPEGQVYAEAKMYGVIGKSPNKLEFRKSIEVSQDGDVEGGGFGKLVERCKTGRGTGDSDSGKDGKENEYVESGMVYQEAMFYAGTNGITSKISTVNNEVKEDSEMYEEPIRSWATNTSRAAVNKKGEPDNELLYEEPIRSYTNNASRSAVNKKDGPDNEIFYEEPIRNSATNGSTSAVFKKGEPEMLYEEPNRHDKTNTSQTQSTTVSQVEDKHNDMIYQEATLYSATSASRNIPTKSAVFANNPDEELDGRLPDNEDESIYAEATFYNKRDRPKIPEKPVVGKKTATLVENDMDLSEFAEPGDEDTNTEGSRGNDSEEGESVYAEATLYGSVETGMSHKPPVATPRKNTGEGRNEVGCTGNSSDEGESIYVEATLYGTVETGRPHKPPKAAPRKKKVAAKKSATLVRQDSDDF